MSKATDMKSLTQLALLLVCLALMALAGCSDSPKDKAATVKVSAGKAVAKDQGKQEQKAKGPLPLPPVPAQIHGPASARLLVNGLPAVKISPDLPVWVTCVLDNPKAKPLNLDSTGLSVPTISGVKGEKPGVTWRAVIPKEAKAPPVGNLAVHWIMQGTLAPGIYQVEMDRKDQGEVIAARPVRLEIVAGAASADEISRAKRRLLALEGRWPELLTLVNAQLAKTPEARHLLMEQIDALAASGKQEKARQKLTGLIKKMQEEQEAANPDKPPHIPYWLVQYLRVLNVKTINSTK